MNNKQMEMMAREHDMSAIDAEVAEEVVQAAANGVMRTYQNIEDAVVSGYKKIEDKFTEKFLNEDGTMKTGKIGDTVVEGYKKIENGVVSGYKKIEDGAVEGFNKVNDKIIEKVFSKDGETVEETKKRLSGDK